MKEPPKIGQHYSKEWRDYAKDVHSSILDSFLPVQVHIQNELALSPKPPTTHHQKPPLTKSKISQVYELKETYIRMFIETLLLTSKIWKKYKCPCTRNSWCIYHGWGIRQ